MQFTSQVRNTARQQLPESGDVDADVNVVVCDIEPANSENSLLLWWTVLDNATRMYDKFPFVNYLVTKVQVTVLGSMCVVNA